MAGPVAASSAPSPPARRKPSPPTSTTKSRSRSLAVRRPLQLDDVALRVADVERGAASLRAVTRLHFADLDAGGGQVRAQAWLVELGQRQAEVIEVAALGARPCAAHLAERPVQRDQVDQLGSGAQLIEAEPLLRLLQR